MNYHRYPVHFGAWLSLRWSHRPTPDAHLLRSSVVLFQRLSRTQQLSLVGATIFYVVAGTLHFIKPEIYVRIVPPYIPWHLSMVRSSGALEILGGLGLLIPRTRRAAAWALTALLVTVFPANIYVATNPFEAGAVSIAPAIRWGRLAVQPLLGIWLLWCTRPRPLLR